MSKIISQEQTDKKRDWTSCSNGIDAREKLYKERNFSIGIAPIDIVGKLVTQEVIRYHLEQLFREIQEEVKNEKVTDDRLDSYIAAMRHLG